MWALVQYSCEWSVPLVNLLALIKDLTRHDKDVYSIPILQHYLGSCLPGSELISGHPLLFLFNRCILVRGIGASSAIPVSVDCFGHPMGSPMYTYSAKAYCLIKRWCMLDSVCVWPAVSLALRIARSIHGYEGAYGTPSVYACPAISPLHTHFT